MPRYAEMYAKWAFNARYRPAYRTVAFVRSQVAELAEQALGSAMPSLGRTAGHEATP